MVDGQELTLHSLVNSLGLLEGIWLASGINPEQEILKLLRAIVLFFAPSANVTLLFIVLPVFAMLVTFLGVYQAWGGY